VILVFGVSPLLASGQTVDLAGVWKKGEYLKSCDPAKEARFTVQGPGKIHFKITIKPHQQVGGALTIPVSWTEYRANGTSSGWGAYNQPPFQTRATGDVNTLTQLGQPVKNSRNGVPIEAEVTWGVNANEKHTLGVRLGVACQMMGSAGFTQWGQENRITVTYSSGGGTASHPTPTPARTSTQASTTIFDNGNAGGVQNHPTHATVFTLNRPTRITLIQDYHWNGGHGASPGTISLQSGGRTIGTWRASGTKGQGGGFVYWVCNPNVVLQPGTYTVVDSDPATWSQNSGSGGSGITHIEGSPAG